MIPKLRLIYLGSQGRTFQFHCMLIIYSSQLEQNRTALHVACKVGNLEFIDLAFKSLANKVKNPYYPQRTDKQTPESNNVYCFSLLSQEDSNNYKKDFANDVLAFANWEIQFIQTRGKTSNRINPSEDESNVHIDYRDFFGNTPLHLASLAGHNRIVQYLLDKGADMNLENDELFKPRELTQSEVVLQVYRQRIHQISKTITLTQLNNSFLEMLQELLKREKKLEEMLEVRNLLTTNKVASDSDYRQIVQDFNLFTQELFVPDFIIRCKLTEASIKQTTLNQTPYFFELNQSEDSELSRINFQISLLQSAKFEIFLMKSQFEPGVHYIMLQHTESELEDQADLMNLQVKLMDSYDLEEFQKVYQQLFEPFRSRQRQQIIENHIKRILNLNELIRSKIIESFYRMHKAGGINKIKEFWIQQDKWYLPQPLNQIFDYLKEGRNRNFSSITVLRLYFGEKISFFFAWKSYITCAFIFLGLPGIIIQLYIVFTGDYFPPFIPWWVCYVCLWSTLQVEFWKRKTYEITARWGCLDLMDEVQRTKQLCANFKGYEEIYSVTGQLTKHQEKSKTIFKVCLSVLILGLFLAATILTIVGVNYLLQLYGKQNIYIQLSLNIIQGVGIFILNMSYTYVSYFTAQYENHKYQEDYERSLIYKNSAFKFINSYLSIFYAAFVTDEDKSKDENFQNLLVLLVPVLIVKQLQYMMLKVVWPLLHYKYFLEADYFTKQKENMLRQKQLNREDSNMFFDRLEKLYNYILVRMMKRQPLQTSRRAVLKLGVDQGPPTLEAHIDADQIELDNLKSDFEGTLDYFMEGIIDLGYITLFAAAFPVGAAIAVFVNVMEIRLKILSLVGIYKRPECERCAGIGEWLNVMEYMGIVSVFTNFSLLYVRSKNETVQYLYGYEGDNQRVILWLYFLTVALILLLKYFFSWIIPDTPDWVVQEIQKLAAKEHINTGQREALRKAETKLEEAKRNLEQSEKDCEKNRKIVTQDIQNRNETIIRLTEQIQRIQRQSDTEAKIQMNDPNLIKSLIQIKMSKEVQRQTLLGIHWQKHLEIQHNLLMERLRQIDCGRLKATFICQSCQVNEAVFDCEECSENYCFNCFFQEHQKMPKKNGLIAHEVLLLKSLKFYEPASLQGMAVKRLNKLPNNKQAAKFEIELMDLDQQRGRWQKIQKFCLPVVKQSQLYSLLPKFYKLLAEEYQAGIAEGDETVEMMRIFRFKKIKDGQFSFYESEGQKAIRNFEGLNVEEKIWLNRLVYLGLKRGQGYQEFYNACRVLQTGTLEKKIQLLLDLTDTDEDGYISKSELEQIFLISMVQDTHAESQIGGVMRALFRMQTYDKKTAFEYLMEQIKLEDVREFITALVQKDS